MVVLFALAVARISVLITDDRITLKFREAVIDRVAPGPDGTHPLATLVVCPWCVSIWVGFALAPVVYYLHTNPVVAVVALALASSQVTGMIANVGR